MISVTWCLCCLAIPAADAAGILPRLIEEAVASHPLVRSQQAGTDAAKAGVDAARWQFFPTPSLSVEQVDAEANDTDYQGDDRVATLRLQQPLWAGGRLTAGLEKADATHRSKDAAIEEARQQLALQTVQAYGDWLTAHLKEEAAGKSVQRHEGLYDQVTRRLKGMSSKSDQVLASGRLQQARAELAVAQIQGNTALARLAQLLGRQIDTRELTADPSRPLPVQQPREALVDAARGRSPELERLKATAQAQQAEIGVYKASLSPEVYVRLERQDGDFSTRGAGTQDRVFLGLQTNLGAGFSAASQIAGARARHAAAQADAEASNRGITERILTDTASYQGLTTLRSALEISLAAAREVQQSYERQFEANRKSWLDVMNATRELAQTEAQLADARGSLLVVSWRLAILTQGVDALPR